MPYRRESFYSGGFYHVYNRGLDKKKIFLHESDYYRFTEYLSKYIDFFPISLHAYCLMGNHFHLLLRQDAEIPISRLMNRLGVAYANYFNLKYQFKGKVFQGRFRVKEISDDQYLLQVSKYIHLNPVAAGLVKNPLNYRWSSISSYMNNVVEPFVTTEFTLKYFSDQALVSSKDYLEFVVDGFTELEEKAYEEFFSM